MNYFIKKKVFELINLMKNDKEQNWKRTEKMNIFSFDIFISRRSDRRMRNMIGYDQK
jgi:hypothetical protein